MRIGIDSLSKTYPRGARALDSITIGIESGMFGLLGPNGAGKTTLMNILVTLLEPTSGTVTINGLDMRRDREKIRALIGYLPQELDVFPKLKAWEFIDFSARLAGIISKRERKRMVDSLLEKVRLADDRGTFCNDLSGGMKRRLGIAQALIGSPRLLVVDEPTAGLDPEERIRFRGLITDLASDDVTIILSTHIVGDISSSCRDMAMLDRGRIVHRGSPEGLSDMARGHTWRVSVPRDNIEKLKTRYPVVTTIPAVGGFDVELVAERLEGYEGAPIEPNLEHAYVYFHEFVLGKSESEAAVRHGA